MFDYSKLIGRIIEKFGSRGAFALAYGVSDVTMSKKLCGRTRISTDDIVKMSAPDLLDIAPSEYHEYFFKFKVQED